MSMKKERAPRAQWLAEHSQERTKPWVALGISRSTFFERKKKAREAEKSPADKDEAGQKHERATAT